jgi:subtilisin family serine protease
VAALVLVAGLGMPVGTGGTGGAGAAPGQANGTGEAAGPDGVLPPGGRWSVTLLTGEVVEVWSDADGRAGASVREHVGSLRTFRKPSGDLYVMPVRITPLLVDVLDNELFNVTGLVRQRLDDASIDAVPLIVQHGVGTSARSAVTTLSTTEGEQPLPSIDAVATEVPKGDADATGELLAELSGDVSARSRSVAGITRIWLDRRVTTQSTAPASQPQPPLDGNLTQVGADDAWAAGLTGDGVRVAVLDTGIDAQHPDLAGRIVAQENFSFSPDVVDRVGHGTHVAATIAGTGAAAEGARRGVAPDADLLIGKVLDDDGFGFDSEIIAGMEWAAPQADVVNMSVGSDFPSDGTDPLSQAVDALTEQHGTLFVVAAGNSGPDSQTIGSPAAADRALTVGAVDGSDVMADFSSRGPLVDSNELKPEVVAPGVDIVAARAAGTAMGTPVDDDYTAASGTSMATPHVAGAAAVLVQQHPDWTGDQVKSALIGATDPTAADGYDAGAGRIDAGDAIEIPALADRDVVDVNLPDPRTAPHTEPIVWTNTDDQPLTLALDAELEDRQGDPIDGVSVEPAEITVPAGGTGTATLTIDGAQLDDGLYSGVVTADPTPEDTGTGPGEDDDVRTPVGLWASPEMATLTIAATPPAAAGDDTPFGSITIVNLDDADIFNLVGGLYVGANPTIDVPVGRYAVVGDVTTLDVDRDVVAQVGDPDVTIDGDTTVAFDGSDAVPFTPVVEGVDDATPVATNVGVVITPTTGTGGVGIEADVYSWYPSPPVLVTEMEGDPAHFAVRRPVVRLQAPHMTARIAGAAAPIEVTNVNGDVPAPPEGTHTWRAVDVGDGQDLSAARDQLAVVALPADRTDRENITHRAEEAGVAVLAFVDPSRPLLTLSTINVPFTPWGDVPVMAAAGSSASALQDAAAAGDDVTITVEGSPYVYDLALPARPEPHPVVSRAAQRRLARLDERFHRDPDGTGAEMDRRRAISMSLMELDSWGPLPERRTAHLTSDVTWQSYVIGDGLIDFLGFPMPASVALSITPETRYAAGSRQRQDWLRRPMPPGPGGHPLERNFCQPRPVERTTDTMFVAVAPFQDGRDRFTCNAPATATLTLERDGTVVGTVPTTTGEFAVPAARGNYRLIYQQTGNSPYPHTSTTTWSFRSTGDPDPAAEPARIPLVVVDYDLPLDTRNQPTSRTATFTVRQVTGVEPRRIDSLRVWTSTDDGTTWRPAPAHRHEGGTFRVTLPVVADGTGVSLRVDARDVAGNRIEQSLVDAYIG